MSGSQGRGTAAAVALVGFAAAVVTLCAVSPAAYADSLPASIRACAHEPDSLKRLVCFDKEVARYNEEPAAAAPEPVAPTPPAVPKHVAAKVVSVENFPDAIVVHLDNGQVWEQIQESSADANLRAGDTVSIDRELGSFWLSGKNGAALKVKQKK